MLGCLPAVNVESLSDVTAVYRVSSWLWYKDASEWECSDLAVAGARWVLWCREMGSRSPDGL